MNLDFDRDFAEFVQNDGRSVITEIHTIIPTLSPEQQQVLSSLIFFCQKYDLSELKSFIDNYGKMASKNKNLNFVRSFNFKNLLKAYSMEEYMRGIKVSTQNNIQGGLDK